MEDLYGKLGATGIVFAVVFAIFIYLASEMLPERVLKFLLFLLYASCAMLVVGGLGKILSVIWL